MVECVIQCMKVGCLRLSPIGTVFQCTITRDQKSWCVVLYLYGGAHKTSGSVQISPSNKMGFQKHVAYSVLVQGHTFGNVKDDNYGRKRLLFFWVNVIKSLP